MSLTTPTTQELNDNIIAQLEASLSQTIPLLPKSFLRVLAKILAGVFIILYKYGGFIFLQMFVSTASDKATVINGKSVVPLTQWGRLIGVGDPVAATQAELKIDITVENQVGSLLAGSQLLGATNGVTYLTLTTVPLSAPVVQVNIVAVSDQSGGGGAGVIGNLDPLAVVSFANPLSNVARDAVVDSQVVTAADGESTEAYRQRVLDRFQKRPQGGAYADYEAWGEEVVGIINVYPYTGDPGEVDVYSEATVASSGNPDGIPTAPQLQAVLDSIELDEGGLATRRPVNAYVNSLPITRASFEVVVNGITQVEDLAAVEASVETAIEEYFVGREPYIAGLTVPPRRDNVQLAEILGVISGVVSSAGGIFSTATLTKSAIPTPLYILGEGEKAKVSSITFT